MILEARNDFVILVLKPVDQVSGGGVLIARTADTEIKTGRVVSVGMGRWDGEWKNPPPCEVDDVVIFNQHTGHAFPPEYGDDLICVRAVDIIGVISE